MTTVSAPMAGWQRTTRLHFGAEAGRQTLAQGPAVPTVLLTDLYLPASVTDPLAAAAEAAAPGRLRTLRLDPATVTLESIEELAGQLAGAARLVAVGGGSVLDAAALARLLAADADAAPRIRHGGARPGLVAFPAQSGSAAGCELVAVPTTVGTAAESSAAATVLVADARKLVMCASIAADIAVLDPRATATLPRHLLLEGVLEALCRLLNTYVLTPGPNCPAAGDAEARSLLTRLARAGHTAAGTPAAPDELRAEIALLSAQTVLGWSMLGRDPFAGKVWYLSNELSLAAGVRKMSATVTVLPVVWSRILDGDTRFGEAARLRAAWQAVQRGLPELPDHPAEGVRELARRWDVAPCPPDTADPARLAARAARGWGSGLPMLGAFRTHELRTLYADVLEGAVA
ncbi:daptide-type RiPP biosynthesis dehydogenase [Streptomyces sp. NPDC092296]|uniref:daptide-type RiPP biosynthesis dehydogenase n=1 Tax=Streptomyces sp. NPDC092296 TaxID=3366012 RepID=UPI003809755A